MNRSTSKKGKYQNTASYLNAALDIVREQGIEQLTMRKMAQHMGVSAMAVYKHFPNKDELLKAALDEFIARARVIPDSTLPWDEWIEQMAHRMFDALRSDARWLSILGSTQAGPNAMLVTTTFIDKMQEAGFEPQQAFEAYLAVIHTLIGAVSIQAALDRSNQIIAADFSPLAGSGDVQELVGKKQIDISLPLVVQSLRVMLESRPGTKNTGQQKGGKSGKPARL